MDSSQAAGLLQYVGILIASVAGLYAIAALFNVGSMVRNWRLTRDRPNELDDARTAYAISGSLALEYAASSLDFTWECEVLEKWGVLKVTDVRHDPQE